MVSHPLDQLTSDEIRIVASSVIRSFPDDIQIRFNSITLHEPSKDLLTAFEEHYSDNGNPVANGGESTVPREADVVLLIPQTGRAWEVKVSLPNGEVVSRVELKKGIQPPFTIDDCLLAEKIVKDDMEVQKLVKERYRITDMEYLAADPWSVHVIDKGYPPLKWKEGEDDGVVARLVQAFLYERVGDLDDHYYAHPLDILPIVDLNKGKVVLIEGLERTPPKIPKTKINYHRRLLKDNVHTEKSWRSDPVKPLDIVQNKGPSFRVENSLVKWQKWEFRIGFNYREGLVLHNIKYAGRPILWRASLVEMAVPYGDPHPLVNRKCAFDVGDFGIGVCANSLALNCDCLGHIQYFDATLSNSEGEPYMVKNAICMHEEDAGLLWKHMEYRTGHTESRRSRRLVVSFIATVVNYEYLFYWTFTESGTIELEIKLSGILSTNLLSEGEEEPEYGTLVAPGVNAQVHQHMFSVRLDTSIDGTRNTVVEVDVKTMKKGSENPAGNAFRAVSTPLNTEAQAQRVAAPARTWKITNSSSYNQVSAKPVSYKLVPFTRGGSQPLLLTSPESNVTARGQFATKSLWVTPYNEDERYPAGKYPTQGTGGEGLPAWTAANRSVENCDIVLWHTFGVVHIPRVEDFPVMPVEVTGFSLKPDGFFSANPAIDIPPAQSTASKCCNGSS
eukprot:Plantae.Rhodophyta-Hildenbrandia_rubra.ctg16062.p1 GENE.Plantae.Rhodophyta-Hildenbrandia_rubra.ctg16062~~Plantae.Rhodophyta-Hildenbrandia_rubra.ctg16062.p1  ORF type:complete len:673 (-),score=115.48 Plantae.Rhodophyta-Hildenbrandia_rubra.ctg16062:3524-5542(-)